MMAAAWSGFAVKSNSHVSPALGFWHAKTTDEFETGIEVAQSILDKAGFEVVDGRLQFADGRADEGVASLELMLERFPEDARGHAMTAGVYAKRGDAERAEMHRRRAAKLEGGH